MLKKIGRTELISQLEKSVSAFGGTDNRLSVPMRDGGVWSVVKVEERGNGVFLCTAPFDEKLKKLSEFFGSTLHEHDTRELVSALKSCTGEDVWLQWPDDDPRSVPGKVLCVCSGEGSTTYVFPVPKDIEDIGNRIHAECAKKCKSAKMGLRCEECEAITSCEVLEGAEQVIKEEIRKERQ